jgi:hypothetical protein
MTSNIKPGIVRHVERGVGLARRTETYPDGIVITFLGPQNLASSTTLLDGWENVDVVKPGHVQVRVDDLQREDFNHGRTISSGSLADIRLWNACQGDTQPDEAAPRPTEMTVTLGCPECGGEVEAHVWLRELQGGCYAVSTPATHACPPPQPDEPTLFGARIIVTDDLSGKAERWCRQHDECWASENGALMTWAYLTQRGTVTIGWDE